MRADSIPTLDEFIMDMCVSLWAINSAPCIIISHSDHQENRDAHQFTPSITSMMTSISHNNNAKTTYINITHKIIIIVAIDSQWVKGAKDMMLEYARMFFFKLMDWLYVRCIQITPGDLLRNQEKCMQYIMSNSQYKPCLTSWRQFRNLQYRVILHFLIGS